MSLQWPWTSLLAVMAVVSWIVVFRFGIGRPAKRPSLKRPLAFEADPLIAAHAMLAGFWAHGGDHPAPHADAETAVLGLERRYGIVLPADFRAYLLYVAPKEDHWDDGDAIWWPPTRIRNIPEEYAHALDNPAVAAKAERCLFFADYMIWFWAWIICCEEGEDYGRIAVIAAGERWVADSFTDFVKAYVADPMSVC
ncbi:MULTISPECIES: hypothetical protein [unclassified Sphingomonas]|uniref:hypothetical protein n=1 Tax=Sphingomonas TaxID=13687 RepID=UPI001AD2C8EA|nr:MULTISPECIES: hypothetical protein [unclassified Sphingomonas]MBN8810126.1 SMI1/KNR4 family protein [Sphingomonas sp.]